LNLVFDLGGVVVRWDPDAIISGVFTDPQLKRKAKTALFEHADWLELDRGTLGRDEAIARAAQRSGISVPDMKRLMHAVPPSLTVFPETVALLRRLKAKGYPLYCLSNMHFASIEHLEQNEKFWDVFQGRVISCRLNLCKPEPAIYEHLLRAFGLQASETIFIDDVQKNLDGAAKLGIRTIRFEDARQCERELARLGVR
jgi:putative hydrolase of the HAD superfamily